MANENENGLTEAELAILKVRLEEYQQGNVTLHDLDDVIRQFGFDPIALRAEAEAEYEAEVLAPRIASLNNGEGISFEELIERVGFDVKDFDGSHGICRGGLIHTDPDEIPHQLGSLSPTVTIDKDHRIN